MHYFNDGCKFVRRGKAVGSDNLFPVSGIVQQNELGHKKKAASSSLADGECFYTLFLSLANSNQTNVATLKTLRYIRDFSLSVKRTRSDLNRLRKENVFFDSSLYINNQTRTKIRGCSTLREKHLVVVGYFFEMCYDICLQKSSNVSNNTGFESILGVLGNHKRS